MLCSVCKKFLPPGFTEPIPNTNLHKCKFCIQGKDKIMSISKIHGDVQWDIKEKIIHDYKVMLDYYAKSSQSRKGLIKTIN